MKCKRLRWVGHVVRMKETWTAFSFMGKAFGKHPLERPTSWKENVKMNNTGDCRAVYGEGLRPTAFWDFGFESCRGHGCLSFVNVVCCQVEVFAIGRCLVQRESQLTVVCHCAWSRNLKKQAALVRVREREREREGERERERDKGMCCVCSKVP
jgi:hypothetical protein